VWKQRCSTVGGGVWPSESFSELHCL